MKGRARLFAAVVIPGASFMLLEMAACTVDVRGADAAYVRRLVGLIGLGELGALLATAALGASLAPRAVATSAAFATGLAVATGVLLPALHLLSNGLVAPLRVATHGRLLLTGVALAGALVCGMLCARRARRRAGTGSTLLDVVAGPALLPPALLFAGEAILRAGIRDTALLAVVLLLAAGVAALVLGRLLARRAGSRGAPVAGVAALPLLALAAAATLVLGGRAPFPELSATAGDERPDVLLVVLDTVRADAAPASLDAAVPTPALTRLAAGGQTWANAFSTSAWTVPAHASLFTGLEADEHGSDWASPALATWPPTLAEQLAAAGWRTGGFSANPYIGPGFAFDRGFAEFREAGVGGKRTRPWLVRMAPALFDPTGAVTVYEGKGGFAAASDALHFLASDPGRPAFVFVNLLEAHLPYWPPDRWLARVESAEWSHDELRAVDLSRFRALRPDGERTARERDGIRRLYAASVAHVDELVGRILGALERAGRLDDTVIVLVGDHGENLGEHRLLDHQLGVWDTLLRVPLVVHFPQRLDGGVRHGDLVSLADVAPALRVLAGVDPDAGGGPLLGATSRDWIWFRYDRPSSVLKLLRRDGIDPAPWERELIGVRGVERKWIEASDGRHEAYDLRRDPAEEKNLFQPGQPVPPGFEPLVAALAARRARVATASVQR